MNPNAQRDRLDTSYFTDRFQAMGCSCEILVDKTAPDVSHSLLTIAEGEALRIETKYSRYRPGNIVDHINSSQGQKVRVDEETAALLDFAANNHELSGGLFDLTSGVLRKVWQFDGRTYKQAPENLAGVLAHVGWQKVIWERPFIQLPGGFEIDFGGICKEYAADKILALLKKETANSVLVNLGGDIAVFGTRLWSVGIEDISRPGQISRTVHIRSGGIATSGTTQRFIRMKGKTYGHILDPRTGCPVDHAPASVTVAATTCTEAGFWSTLAVLQGPAAETFLTEQSLEFWCSRNAS